MRILLPLLAIFLFSTSLIGQPQLKPSIGIGDLPDNETPICDIPLYLYSFADSGFFPGDTIPDFNLFDLENNEVVISDVLAGGKPLLLVTGSYTCPVFRNKIQVLNELYSAYQQELEILIVYGVEAHPIVDISPYFGFVNPGNTNIIAGVTYMQPTTYGQRKSIVAEMLNSINILPTILIDGPCNNWWENFGPAPNNAYLIDPNGVILSKHPWFDKHPYDIHCDLEEYLGLATDCDGTGGGVFTFQLTSPQSVEGPAGSTIYVTGELANSLDGGVEIEIRRQQLELPPDWSSSICTDVCYPSDQDEALVWLDPGETLEYTNYFYTSETPGTGKARIYFRNTANPNNEYTQWMEATTVGTTPSTSASAIDAFQLFPNPVKTGEAITILSDHVGILEVFDPSGKRSFTTYQLQGPTTEIHLPLSAGIYYYRYQLMNGSTHTGKVLILE